MLQQATPVLLWRKEVVLWGTGVNSVWCLVVVLLCLLVALWLLRPNRHLPPGPWELPLVRYLLSLNGRAPAPHADGADEAVAKWGARERTQWCLCGA